MRLAFLLLCYSSFCSTVATTFVNTLRELAGNVDNNHRDCPLNEIQKRRALLPFCILIFSGRDLSSWLYLGCYSYRWKCVEFLCHCQGRWPEGSILLWVLDFPKSNNLFAGQVSFICLQINTAWVMANQNNATANKNGYPRKGAVRPFLCIVCKYLPGDQVLESCFAILCPFSHSSPANPELLDS